MPKAKIYNIDPNLKFRRYISDRVHYFNTDFSEIDWSGITEKEDTVLFFDDHQNALERIKQANQLGFKQFIFEDNYPAIQGDCYSLKKAFQHAGFRPENRSVKAFLKKLIKKNAAKIIEPNEKDAKYLKKVLEVYYEFPPVLKKDRTRWGDPWEKSSYRTPDPLYQTTEKDFLELFNREATFYTWVCYAKLK